MGARDRRAEGWGRDRAQNRNHRHSGGVHQSESGGCQCTCPTHRCTGCASSRRWSSEGYKRGSESGGGAWMRRSGEVIHQVCRRCSTTAHGLRRWGATVAVILGEGRVRRFRRGVLERGVRLESLAVCSILAPRLSAGIGFRRRGICARATARASKIERVEVGALGVRPLGHDSVVLGD